MFKGVYTAIVTPFAEGKVDLKSFAKLVDFQLSGGVDGLVVCGTTGEAATLSLAEKQEVIKEAVKLSAGKVPIIAGTGSNNTAQTIEVSKIAKELGVSAALVVAPYYNKPPQAGLYRHFQTIAQEADLPIIVYNVPGRTAVNIAPETVIELAKIPQIKAVKEASGDLAQMQLIIDNTSQDFSLLGGDDPLFLPLLSSGGKGIISVTSNVLPRQFSEVYRAFSSGDLTTAKKIFSRIFPLCQALFLESNPIPVKRALNYLGFIKNELRLPLLPMSEENSKKMLAILERAKD